MKKLIAKLLIVTLLGGSGIATYESFIDTDKLDEVETEFFEYDEYSDEEKDYIWNEVINIVTDDLSNKEFGGKMYAE